MYAPTAARARFVDQSVDTASPSRQLVLLYDRLCLDLARGERAQRAGDRQQAHDELVHAQDIVAALIDGLDDSWEGAARLTSIYHYLLSELVCSNVTMDADRTAALSQLVEPLRDIWTQASAIAAAEHATVITAVRTA